jgi:flavin-dependent dehydrogenase
MRYEADVLIIGAGPAGCAAAVLLADAGYSVTVIDKHGLALMETFFCAGS